LRIKCCLSIIAVLLASRCLPAGTGYGEISGAVLEWNGGCAPLASLTLVHRGTGSLREIVADPKGKYHVSDLLAGLYTIMARAVGTSASAEVSAVVEEGHQTEVTIVLSKAGSVLESSGLRDLPLLHRDYLDLVRQAPEITVGQPGGNIEGFGPYTPRGNSSFNSAGQRGQNNNFLVDGVDNNEVWVRGAILQPSAESIQDVNLLTNYIPAQFGSATGAVVNVETRSGQKLFHGSVYEYFENSGLDAPNFFDRLRKPNLAQNQFGASAGGPIRGNGWFFFANGELLRERRGLTVVSTVPGLDQRGGNFDTVPIYDPLSMHRIRPGVFVRQPLAGNRVPLSRIPSAARNLIGLYPDPNLPGAVDNYLFTPTLSGTSGRYNVRTDKIFSARSALFARVGYGRYRGESPGAFSSSGGWAAGSDSTQQADAMNTALSTWGGVISHTFAIHPGLLNEFRAGAARFDLNANPQDYGLNASAALGIPGLGDNGLPNVLTSGLAQLGAAGPVPLTIRTTSYQLEDTLSWAAGQHTWKFGLQAIRRSAEGTASAWNDRGTFFFTPDYTNQPGVDHTGSSLASLLLGYPAEIRRDVQFAPYALRGWEWSGFVQDEIRLWPRLTIQVGIRYSLLPPVTESQGRLVNFNFDRNAPALNQFAGKAGVNQYAGLPLNWRAIAPRAGLVFDVFGNGSTLLRGGFSTAYDSGAYLWEGSLAQNPPFASRQDFFNGSLFIGRSLADGLPNPQPVAMPGKDTLNRVGNAIYAIEPKTFTPYADLYSVSIERSLRPGLTLEIGGTGSMGIHLYANVDLNQEPFPGPWLPSATRQLWSAPLLSRIDYFDFAGGSTYYAAHVKLSGQLARGLRVLMSYTYGKSVDDAAAPESNQQSRPSGPQNFSDPGGARSASPFDIAQRLLITGFYELPFKRPLLANWRTSAIITAQTGFPFTPELAVNGLNNGGFQLPNRVGDGSLPSGQRSYLHWFNTSLDRSDPQHAFETPALYQYGNAGYDIVRGPGLATVDASLARTFAVTERLHLEARAEAFNLLNRTNFALPNRILGLDSSGVIGHTATASRQMQLVVRAQW
jgi:hypothetical protein